MTGPSIRLMWSEREAPASLSSVAELDQVLDRLDKRSTSDRPTIVVIEAHRSEVTLGLGLTDSFVQVARSDGNPPYFATVGEVNASGVVTYYFCGEHHTEIPKRNLIPRQKAREVVRTFAISGQRSENVAWEQV